MELTTSEAAIINCTQGVMPVCMHCLYLLVQVAEMWVGAGTRQAACCVGFFGSEVAQWLSPSTRGVAAVHRCEMTAPGSELPKTLWGYLNAIRLRLGMII
jgi:hypothetical protein